MKKINNIFLIIAASAFIFGMSVWCILKPTDDFSVSERRKLNKFPEFSLNFSEDFQKYSSDQFPIRETFRRISSIFSLYVLNKQDVNNIYIAGEYASELERVINEESVNLAVNRFSLICDKYLNNNKVYFAIIPDKNYYLAKTHNYPYLDYNEFIKMYSEGMKEYTDVIDLSDTLHINNFYHTDTHWSQDTLLQVLQKLDNTMRAGFSKEYAVNSLDKDFYGVYYGQSALPLRPDRIQYLTSDYMNSLKAYCYDSGKAEELNVYDMDKANGRDPYEMFLSGSKALITIENPAVDTEKNLILFRDSFGSSLAPLLASVYSKITLVDIRYISAGNLDNFVDFDGADVLFLYSTQVLNNCEGQFIF